MGCFVVLFALISPRLALFFVAIFSDLLSRAFDSWFIPLLGFFLLPWTTLAYACMWEPRHQRGHRLRVVHRDPRLPRRPQRLRADRQPPPVLALRPRRRLRRRRQRVVGEPCRDADLAATDPTSRRSGSAAWACPSSTAKATTPSRRRRSTGRSRSGSTSSTPPTCTAAVPTRSSSAARSPDRRDERLPGDQVRDRAHGRPERSRRGRQPRLRPEGDRRLARAARHRPRGPLVPASRRPRRPDRGDRRRDGRGRRRPARSATSASARRRRRRSGERIRPTRSRPSRPSSRSGSAEPSTRSSPHAVSSGSGSSPTRPLGRGFLTGRFNSSSDFGAGDFRSNDPRMGVENFDRNRGIVEAVRDVAEPQGRDAGADRARLGPRARRRSRADSGNPPDRSARGERGRCRRRARRLPTSTS